MRAEITAAAAAIGLGFTFGEKFELNQIWTEAQQDELCALLPYTINVKQLGSGRALVKYDIAMLFLQPVDLEDMVQDNAGIVDGLRDYANQMIQELETDRTVEIPEYNMVMDLNSQFDTNLAGLLLEFTIERQETIC